jgi:hypothetical protein
MRLSVENLITLKEPIMNYLDKNYLKEMTELNRKDELDQFFYNFHLHDILDIPKTLETKGDGKILVIGESIVKDKDLIGIIKSLNLDKSRVEFVTDYENVKNYDFANLRYNSNYRLILVGPMPHKVIGINGKKYSSMIEQMEQNPEIYPKVLRLTTASKLKITKTNFKKSLLIESQNGYI